MTHSLPVNPDIVFLKKQAKRLMRQFRDNDHRARNSIQHFHPAPNRFKSLHDAQWVVALSYGFSNWEKLSNAVTLLRKKQCEIAEKKEAFIRLACGRVCGQNREGKYLRANKMLASNPSLASFDFHSALVSKDIDNINRFLRRDPELASRRGGPFNWVPEQYIAESRIERPRKMVDKVCQQLQKSRTKQLNTIARRKKSLKIAFYICLSALGFSQNVVAQEDMFPTPIVVPVPNANEYVRHHDVVYRKTDAEEMKADIFLPKKIDSETFPAVIFVHGGPIPPNPIGTAKDSTFYQNYGALVTQSGFAGIVFNHRMHSLSDFETPKQDIQALFSFVQRNAEQYSLDKNKVCVWYFSGGGSFVAAILDEKPAWLQCLVIYYGAMGSDVLKAMGIPMAVKQQNLYNPVPLLENKTDWDPAIFIAEAGKDAPALNDKLREFSQAALENNWKVEYWNHPGGPHGFDAFTNDHRSKAIINRSLDFLKDNL